ncbi:Dystrophin, isoform B, partial [Gryllus bimaculatus]
MIQSVTSKAEDLLQAQPASEISSKYETLSKQAKELYAKQKETVEQHQAFIDAGNDFMQWIRASKEKLSKCSEPTGDKESLSSKVTQLKVLQSAQDEGQQKLEKALEQGNVACQVADEEDKEVIEEEVALLQEEFDTYIESLNRTKSLLEVGIVKWTEYEDHYQEASDWLTQTEQLVQTFNKLQDSLEEKKNVLEEFQAHLQTLFDWQKELDRLNMKAQVLLETCADSRISNAVTQMTTKYNALLSLAKEIMRRLELHYQEHQQHSTLYQECQDWVDRTRDKLHECQEIPNTLTDVNNKVATVKGIRQSLEQGQNKLRYVLELKEKVILNTEQNGAAKIQEDTENLKIEFEKLMVDVQDLRQKLAAQATHLEDIHKAQKLLLDWLDEVEQKIQPDEISEKRAVLEKFRNVQRDINCHSEMVDRLKSRVSEEQFVPTKEYNSCLERYQKLKDLVAQNILTLEQQVNKQELQKQAYNDALDWLRKTRIEIQQCSDPHGEKETIQKKEEKMLDIKKTFPDGERLVEHASELSATVMSSVGAEAQDALRQDIQQLKTDWQSLQVMSKETEKMLSKCIAVWNDFTNTFNSMKDWLGEFQAKVAAENEEEKKTPDELQKCRALLQEAIQQKVVMEGLNDRCETLMELSACSWVRDQTVQLQGLYTNLLTSIQVLVSRAEKNLSDHTEFLKAKEEVDSWLKRAHGTVQDCIGVGNETVTRDKLETIQLVSTRMTEGQHLMSVMQDVFAKAINTAPADHQDNLREDMTQLRNSWDQLNMDLTSVMAQLKAALSRWEEYNEQKSQLETWMSNMEETLKETPDTKGELGEMKTLIERFKHLQAEVNSKKGDLDHLLSEAAELAVWASQPTVLEEVQKLQSRWDNLSRRCVTCQEALELEIGEYTAYHNSLQNTEKWILQTSFTLMAHNSLYITNKQQTLEQIQQHEALLEDIQKYQAVLDDIRAKGHGQIKRYVSSTPSIQETIEKQLNNVQDSYNSLLHTAIQIKKRLMESLAKFQEYEETLESIKKNLDVYEQLITKDFQPPVGNLALTHQLLEETRELHNKLQAEKSRLAVAVQACEAAAACISRPSSPQDTMPPPIPDSELLVRARLEDFIDQVQSQMSALTNLVSELEEGQRYCEALQKWIVEQQAIVQDWGSRPLKLRPEAAVAEQQAMKDLESAIKERQQKLRNELPAGENTSNLLEELNQLENKLTAVRGKKDTGQQTIEEFRQKINDIHSFLDTLSKRIEELDRGNGLDCAQKISALADIEKIFNNEASPKVEEVKQLGLKVMDITSNLDAQQVEEQLKSVERRYNDIAKRIQRKSQVLKLTHKGLEGARQEIESARTWILEKMALVQAPPPLGFESKAAEDRQQALKSLVKEVEGKKVLLETLEKRLNNMQAELEPNEQQVLESQLLSLTSDHSNLLAALKAEQEHVAAATDARRKLEADIEAARNWLKAKNGEFKKLGGYVPLRVSAIEAEYQLLKQFENEIKAFHMNNLNEIIKQVNAIEKDCTEPEKQKLKNNLQELLKEYETLNNTVNQKTESLLDLLNSRKQFEGEVNKIKHWLNEAEVATSAEIRVSNMGLLEEQLAKYDKLHKEAENIQGNIDNVILQAKNILLYVSEADKLTLSEEINAMKDKHARITGIIYDRSDALQGQLKQYKDAAAKISESVQFMTEIQKELKDLNRPISSKIEDVQGMLESYEKILADLKANKLKLGHLQVGNVSELQGITQQQDDLIQAIEAQIARLRQLLLLREQFIALITEIMTFITKYTEVVRDIEKEGHTVEEKIRKYDDVIVKIQECEALLASATDKGQQIAAEGSVSDRNSITEQLQSLKQSLQALRRAVEKQREQHEMTVAEHKKLAAELEEVLDWLHANEAAVRSRPLLDRDPTSVNVEIDKHKELATQVNSYLDRIRAVQDSVRHDDGMPGSLLEKLSEANSLLNTLPAELEERGKYLEMNKTLRVEYAALKDRLHNWVRDAEVHLNSNSEGIDFENIVQELEEHKVFFGSEASMKELVSQHIQQAADRIWPSLSAPEQEELSQEQQQLTQSLKNTLNLARSKQALLEQNIEVWRDYCHALDKVQAILSRSQFSDEPGCTLAGLQFSIQKINHALTDIQNQQNEIDLLNDHAKEIKQQADKNNAEKIDSQVKNMNTRWTECITGLETRRDNLQTLSVDWEEFEKNLQNFETLLFSYEEKTRHVDTVVRSKAQITEVKQSLQGLLSEIQDCSSLHDNILSLSVPVIEYLKTTSESAAQSLQEKLNNTSSSYQQLKKTVQNKLSKANEDLEKLTQVQANISKLQGELNPLHSKIQTFDEYGGDWETIEKSLQELVSQVKQAVGSSKDFITQTKEQYTSYQQSTPSDIVQEMSTLELLAETVSNAMDEKERQINRVHSLRSDYNKDTAEVSEWLPLAESRVKDRSVEPQIMKDSLSQIQSELCAIGEKLERLTRNGNLILEKTQNEGERNLIQNTISSLTEQYSQIKSLLDERKQQVGNALDAWQNFEALYNTVQAWVAEKQTFLAEPFQLSSLTQARQRLQEYTSAVKSCKVATKQVQDMTKALELIGQVASLGDLSEKLDEVTEAKGDVESQLLERNALLQETSEEWEQCEKKMKDVKSWIEKSRQSLDSPLYKKKPLRDQLTMREKMIGDMAIQKKKITISVEKLKVHFRSGVGGDTKVTEATEEILQELDQLLRSVKEQSVQLEACLAQLDQYQQEIQQLRQQIVQVEQQLRVVLSPTYSPHDRDKALEEQTVLASGDLDALQTSLKDCEMRLTSLSSDSLRNMYDDILMICDALKSIDVKAQTLEEIIQQLPTDQDVQNLNVATSNLRRRVTTLLSYTSEGCSTIERIQAQQEQQLQNIAHYEELLNEIASWCSAATVTLNIDLQNLSHQQLLEQRDVFEMISQELDQHDKKLKELMMSNDMQTHAGCLQLGTSLHQQLLSVRNLLMDMDVQVTNQITVTKEPEKTKRAETVEMKEEKSSGYQKLHSINEQECHSASIPGALPVPEKSPEVVEKQPQVEDVEPLLLSPHGLVVSVHDERDNTIDSNASPIADEEVSLPSIEEEQEPAVKKIQEDKIAFHVASQTGDSLREPPPSILPVSTKDVAVEFHQPVDSQVQTMALTTTSAQMTENIPYEQHREKIKILKKFDDHEEVVEIATGHPSERLDISAVEGDRHREIFDDSDDNLMVEVKFKGKKSKEKPILQLVRDPDEMSTEVIVEAERRKRIVLKTSHSGDTEVHVIDDKHLSKDHSPPKDKPSEISPEVKFTMPEKDTSKQKELSDPQDMDLKLSGRETVELDSSPEKGTIEEYQFQSTPDEPLTRSVDEKLDVKEKDLPEYVPEEEKQEKIVHMGIGLAVTEISSTCLNISDIPAENTSVKESEITVYEESEGVPDSSEDVMKLSSLQVINDNNIEPCEGQKLLQEGSQTQEGFSGSPLTKDTDIANEPVTPENVSEEHPDDEYPELSRVKESTALPDTDDISIETSLAESTEIIVSTEGDKNSSDTTKPTELEIVFLDTSCVQSPMEFDSTHSQETGYDPEDISSEVSIPEKKKKRRKKRAKQMSEVPQTVKEPQVQDDIHELTTMTLSRVESIITTDKEENVQTDYQQALQTTTATISAKYIDDPGEETILTNDETDNLKEQDNVEEIMSQTETAEEHNEILDICLHPEVVPQIVMTDSSVQATVSVAVETVQTISPEPSPKEIQSNDFISEIDTQTSPAPETFDMGMQTLSPEFKIQDFQTCATQVSSPESVPEKQESEITHSATQVTTETEEGYMQTSPIEQIISDVADVSLQTVIDTNETLDSFVQTSPVPEVPAPTNIQPEDSNGVHEEQISPELQDHVPYIEKTEEAPLAIGGVTVSSVTETVHSSMQTTDMPTISCESQTSPDGFKDTERMPTATVSMQTNSETVISADSYMQTSPMDSFQMETINASIQTETSNTGNISTQADIVLPSEGITVDIQTNKDELTPSVEMSMQTDIAKLPVTETTDTISQTIQSGSGTMPGSDSCIQTTVSELIPSVEGSTQTNLQPSTFIDSSVQTNKEPSTSEQPLHPEFATSPKEPQTEREKDADKQERNESSSEEQLEVNIQASIVFPTERTTLVAQKTVNKQSSPAPQDDREPTHAEKSLKKRHKKKSKRNDKGSANKKPETTEKLSVADVERFVDIRPSSGREINDLKPQPSEQVPDAKELLTPKRTVDDDAEEIVSKSLDGKDPYSQVHIHDYTKSENASERFERQDVQELVMSLKDNEEISLKQDKPIVIEADNVVYKIEDSVVASVPDSVMKEEDIPLKVEPHSANIDDDVQKVDLIIETQSTKNGNEINIQVPETLSDNVSRNFEIIPSEQSSEKSDLITAEECYRKEICYPKENEWKQMQCLVADRVRKLQKERHTTHLSGVLYLATLQQIVADESFEQKNSAFQDDIITLRDAVDSKDKAVIQRSVITIVETVSTWLESIEYHVLLNCQLRTAPTKDHITELGNLKQEIINVGEKVEGLNSVMENVYTMFDGDDASNMKQCISSLQNQVEAMKEVTDEKEQQATKDLNRWEEFLNGVNNVSVLIEELKEHLDQLVETDLYVHRKLELLDHIESTNHSHQQKTIQLMNNAWALLCDFPGHEIPPELYSAYETTRSIEHSVKLERDRQLQLIALADEYEQTLKEFAQIVDVADALVESSIVVSSLEHLQEEMQKHRKFFVNLSHCRCILESLEGNLDTETRNKHSGLHQQLHTRASGILDKAAGRAQQMALAASRWTVLEQGMKEERNWLQVAHQRVPDLQSVTSSEYNQYISLYQSLSADVAVHHGHCAQLIEVARRLQELVLCPGLEARYDEHLEVIAKLQEDINKNLHCLLSFRDTWRNYVTLTEKLFQWMIYAEKELANISSEDQRPGTNMKHFWELKAQYEVHNNIRNEASSNFNAAMKIIPVADENLQCQLNAKLEERWWNVSSQIQNIQTAILEILSNQEVPVKDKLAALQQELQELQSALNDTHRVIKKEEELELYIQRMQVMLGGVEHIQEELSRLGLLSVDETEKVGILLCGAGNIELQIKEELEGAILLREKINAIQKGLNRIRRSYERASNVLDQCEKGVNQGQDAVEQALRNCQGVCDELTTLWQDVMDLRQLLHTLPMSLHLSISPVHLERNISQVQDHHTALESRSAHLLSLLKNRLTMWQHFEQQLELVQQSVQETDYMMELLTVQGSVDYDRLVKATECLEGLYGSLDQREDLLDELRVAAAPLAESCAPEVSAKIKVAVEDVERSWNNTRQTLRELCERYQDAARLWRQYREASDCVKTWAEQQLDSTAHLTPAEALRHVK